MNGKVARVINRAVTVTYHDVNYAGKASKRGVRSRFMESYKRLSHKDRNYRVREMEDVANGFIDPQEFLDSILI